MFREQAIQIQNDLKNKMVFLSGPRQVGKSWLSRELMGDYISPLYLNWDNPQDRGIILNQGWSSRTDLLVFDEIHKMEGWKGYLKGVWDTRGSNQSVLVTGSARLETFRQSGDSLAGRFFHHRLYPLTPSEALKAGVSKPLEHFLLRGGFPEPWLTQNDDDAGRWRRQYLDGLIREDILNFENIHQLKAMNLLVELLRDRVASPLSYQSLAEDLGIAPNTVKRYLEILEALYIIFRVYPHHKSIARSLVQQPKVYFFDNGLVRGNGGPQIENFAALCLLKEVSLREDRDGKKRELSYLRTKEGHEVDFVFVEEGTPRMMIEVKSQDREISKGMEYFHSKYGIPGVLLVSDIRMENHAGPIPVRRLFDWVENVQKELPRLSKC